MHDGAELTAAEARAAAREQMQAEAAPTTTAAVMTAEETDQLGIIKNQILQLTSGSHTTELAFLTAVAPHVNWLIHPRSSQPALAQLRALLDKTSYSDAERATRTVDDMLQSPAGAVPSDEAALRLTLEKNLPAYKRI